MIRRPFARCMAAFALSAPAPASTALRRCAAGAASASFVMDDSPFVFASTPQPPAAAQADAAAVSEQPAPQQQQQQQDQHPAAVLKSLWSKNAESSGSVLYSPHGQHRLATEPFVSKDGRPTDFVLVHLDSVMLETEPVPDEDSFAARKRAATLQKKTRALHHAACDLLGLGGKYFVPAAAPPQEAPPASSDEGAPPAIDEFAGDEDGDAPAPAQLPPSALQASSGEPNLRAVARASFLFRCNKLPAIRAWFLNGIQPASSLTVRARWRAVLPRLDVKVEEHPTHSETHVMLTVTNKSSNNNSSGGSAAGVSPRAVALDLQLLGALVSFQRSSGEPERQVYMLKKTALPLTLTWFDWPKYERNRLVARKSGAPAPPKPYASLPPAVLTLRDGPQRGGLSLRDSSVTDAAAPFRGALPTPAALQAVLRLGRFADAGPPHGWLWIFPGDQFKAVLALARQHILPLATAAAAAATPGAAAPDAAATFSVECGAATLAHGTVGLHKPVSHFLRIVERGEADGGGAFALVERELVDGNDRLSPQQQAALAFTAGLLGGAERQVASRIFEFASPSSRPHVEMWLTQQFAMLPRAQCILLRADAAIRMTTSDDEIMFSQAFVRDCVAMGGRFSTAAARPAWHFSAGDQHAQASEYVDGGCVVKDRKIIARRDFLYRKIVLEALRGSSIRSAASATSELHVHFYTDTDFSAGPLKHVLGTQLGGTLLRRTSKQEDTPPREPGVDGAAAPTQPAAAKAAFESTVWSFAGTYQQRVASSFLCLRQRVRHAAANEDAEALPAAEHVISAAAAFRASGDGGAGAVTGAKEHRFVTLTAARGGIELMRRGERVCVVFKDSHLMTQHWRALLRCGATCKVTFKYGDGPRRVVWTAPTARFANIAQWALKQVDEGCGPDANDAAVSAPSVVSTCDSRGTLVVERYRLRDRVRVESLPPLAPFLSFVPINVAAGSVLVGVSGKDLSRAVAVRDCFDVIEGSCGGIILVAKPVHLIAARLGVHRNLGLFNAADDNSGDTNYHDFNRRRLRVAQAWSDFSKQFALSFLRCGGALSVSSAAMSATAWHFDAATKQITEQLLDAKWVLQMPQPPQPPQQQ